MHSARPAWLSGVGYRLRSATPCQLARLVHSFFQRWLSVLPYGVPSGHSGCLCLGKLPFARPTCLLGASLGCCSAILVWFASGRRSLSAAGNSPSLSGSLLAARDGYPGISRASRSSSVAASFKGSGPASIPSWNVTYKNFSSG